MKIYLYSFFQIWIYLFEKPSLNMEEVIHDLINNSLALQFKLFQNFLAASAYFRLVHLHKFYIYIEKLYFKQVFQFAKWHRFVSCLLHHQSHHLSSSLVRFSSAHGSNKPIPLLRLFLSLPQCSPLFSNNPYVLVLKDALDSIQVIDFVFPVFAYFH